MPRRTGPKKGRQKKEEEDNTIVGPLSDHVDGLVKQMEDSLTFEEEVGACTHGMPDLAPKHSLYQWIAALEREAERFFENEEVQNEIRRLAGKKEAVIQGGGQGKIMDYFGPPRRLIRPRSLRFPTRRGSSGRSRGVSWSGRP